ncbi:MarR family winged helix-turn-helix transcriptional regulator [Muricoccus aerilatus]|uniref:MarR family winged helix-turn-helix transcriptional regulator n=1 Tax=Muricoccus aerilatus TaxID=452982 RepID=UPI0005C1870D|nr:MarR family winged helix-turn-helix transcriptional regulator [Roseomonas aerilata]
MEATVTRQDEELGFLAETLLAVRVITLANRLTRNASAYYRENLDLGMVEWRLLFALEKLGTLTVGALAKAAETEKAAASRAIRGLQERGMVTATGLGGQGGAVAISMTANGTRLAKAAVQISGERDARLLDGIGQGDLIVFDKVLRQLLRQVPAMAEVPAMM